MYTVQLLFLKFNVPFEINFKIYEVQASFFSIILWVPLYCTKKFQWIKSSLWMTISKWTAQCTLSIIQEVSWNIRNTLFFFIKNYYRINSENQKTVEKDYDIIIKIRYFWCCRANSFISNYLKQFLVKWVCLHCTMAVFFDSWTIWIHNLFLKVVFLFQSFWLLLYAQMYTKMNF